MNPHDAFKLVLNFYRFRRIMSSRVAPDSAVFIPLTYINGLAAEANAKNSTIDV